MKHRPLPLDPAEQEVLRRVRLRLITDAERPRWDARITPITICTTPASWARRRRKPRDATLPLFHARNHAHLNQTVTLLTSHA